VEELHQAVRLAAADWGPHTLCPKDTFSLDPAADPEQRPQIRHGRCGW